MYKQYVCMKIGRYGCYLLSIVYIAEQITGNKFDVLEVYTKAVKEKWSDSDCYLNNPDKILEYLLHRSFNHIGKEVSVRHEVVGYQPKSNEYEITRYELNETGVTFSHFVVTRNGELVYDPFGNSRTRKLGKPVSKRILTVTDKKAA